MQAKWTCLIATCPTARQLPISYSRFLERVVRNANVDRASTDMLVESGIEYRVMMSGKVGFRRCQALCEPLSVALVICCRNFPSNFEISPHCLGDPSSSVVGQTNTPPCYVNAVPTLQTVLLRRLSGSNRPNCRPVHVAMRVSHVLALPSVLISLQ